VSKFRSLNIKNKDDREFSKQLTKRQLLVIKAKVELPSLALNGRDKYIKVLAKQYCEKLVLFF
jgi:hypothetical protein